MGEEGTGRQVIAAAVWCCFLFLKITVDVLEDRWAAISISRKDSQRRRRRKVLIFRYRPSRKEDDEVDDEEKEKGRWE